MPNRAFITGVSGLELTAAERDFIRAERLSHEGFEVPPEAFASFFPVVMETCREILGEAWTDAFQAAWDERLRRISGLIAGA